MRGQCWIPHCVPDPSTGELLDIQQTMDGGWLFLYLLLDLAVLLLLAAPLCPYWGWENLLLKIYASEIIEFPPPMVAAPDTPTALLFIHSLNYCAPGTVLDTENIAGKRRNKQPCPCSWKRAGRVTDSNKINLNKT